MREGYTGIDAFLSHMGAVTLTGAPKKNAIRIVEDMERVHRSLRDELAKAPSAYFEPDDPFRELIDRCTVLHYQEHGTHIRVWTADKSPESTGG